MSILVTGGAGYIGSVVVEKLTQWYGVKVVVLDNLSTGYRGALRDSGAEFYLGDIADRDLLDQICMAHKIDACIHMAAATDVVESYSNPSKYIHQNVIGSEVLIHSLMYNGVRKFIFSSSCTAERGASPYGWSKQAVEKILQMYREPFKMGYVALRYYNAAGATETHGMARPDPTHLIPKMLNVAYGDSEHLDIHGDGSTHRDYIHVDDLAMAHCKALKYLEAFESSDLVCQLGTGIGHSVLDVLHVAQRITGRRIPVVFVPDRNGNDTAIATNLKEALLRLDWTAEQDLNSIIESAWKWKQNFPKGYAK